ncbi:MAG: RadC family protein [Marinibacterium sp.]
MSRKIAERIVKAVSGRGFAEMGTGSFPGPDHWDGLSRDALRGLEDLEARIPPAGAKPEPAFTRRFRNNRRLDDDAAAGGGLVTGPDGQAQPHYWGHRERLRTRFLAGGADGMPEYELLELVLFNAIPRIDVKPLAKRLLAEFGDLNGVVAASRHRLEKVAGVTDKVYLQLQIADAIAKRMAQAKVLQREVVSCWDALITYCRTSMAHRETEQFRILFLDRKNVLIADEVQAPGTVDHVPVYPREVAKRALELNASAIILVHNHPSGDPTPSPQDIDMTTRVTEACLTIGVAVHDHVIVGKAAEVSFRSEGLL